MNGKPAATKVRAQPKGEAYGNEEATRSAREEDRARQEGSAGKESGQAQEVVTPARRLAEEALNRSATARIGFYADKTSRPGSVALGLAIRGVGSFLMSIDAKEFEHGQALLMLLGGKPAAPMNKRTTR